MKGKGVTRISTDDKKNNHKILLVDDEPRVLRSLNAVLKNYYHVLTAENTSQARDIMNHEKNISVLVTGQRMPQQVGHELLIWAKEKYPLCSRILMTGHVETSTLENVIKEADVFRYLTKPWNWDDLKHVLEKAVLLNQKSIEQLKLEKKSLNDQKCTAVAVLDTNSNKEKVYQQLAKSHKCDVFFYRSAGDLVNGLWKNNHIGVLFIDTNIGENNTLLTVREIQEKYPALVFVVVTKACSGASAMSMLNQGQVFKCLIKPLTITRLKPMLKASLQQSKDNREKDDLSSQSGDQMYEHSPSALWHKISQLWH